MRQPVGVYLLSLAFLISGCASSQYGYPGTLGQPQEEQSPLTPGMAKKMIIKGQTKQADVMEVFGPPDLVTTTPTGGEMWGYDRVSREVASWAFGIGLGGGGHPGEDAFIGGIAGARAGTTSQTVRTLFLLIYFDKEGTVTDYKLSATRF